MAKDILKSRSVMFASKTLSSEQGDALRLDKFIDQLGLKIFPNYWKNTDVAAIQKKSRSLNKLDEMLGALPFVGEENLPYSRNLIVQFCIIDALVSGEAKACVALTRNDVTKICYQEWRHHRPSFDLLDRFFHRISPHKFIKDVPLYADALASKFVTTLKQEAEIRKLRNEKSHASNKDAVDPLKKTATQSEEELDDYDELPESIDDPQDYFGIRGLTADQIDEKAFSAKIAKKLVEFEKYVLAGPYFGTIPTSFWQELVRKSDGVEVFSKVVDVASSEIVHQSIPIECTALQTDLEAKVRFGTEDWLRLEPKIGGLPIIQSGRRGELTIKDNRPRVMSILDVSRTIELLATKPTWLESTGWGLAAVRGMLIDWPFIIAAIWRIYAVDPPKPGHGAIEDVVRKLSSFLVLETQEKPQPQYRSTSPNVQPVVLRRTADVQRLRLAITAVNKQWETKSYTGKLIVGLSRKDRSNTMARKPMK